MPVLHPEHQSPSAPVPTVTTRPREQNTAVQLEQHTRQTAELQDSQQLPVPPALYPNLTNRPHSHHPPSVPVPTSTTRPSRQNTAVRERMRRLRTRRSAALQESQQRSRQSAELQDSQRHPVPPALYPNLAHRPHPEHRPPSVPVPTGTTRHSQQNTAVRERMSRHRTRRSATLQQSQQRSRQSAELQDPQRHPVPPALYPNLAHRPLSSNHQLLDVNRITSRSTPLCLAWTSGNPKIDLKSLPGASVADGCLPNLLSICRATGRLPE